jgi:hypothetical protein
MRESTSYKGSIWSIYFQFAHCNTMIGFDDNDDDFPELLNDAVSIEIIYRQW